MVLVVIVFICINCPSVHPEIYNLVVGDLIFRMARLCLGRNSPFFSRIGKKLLGRGQKLGRVGLMEPNFFF